jgi:hypothetical protein
MCRDTSIHRLVLYQFSSLVSRDTSIHRLVLYQFLLSFFFSRAARQNYDPRTHTRTPLCERCGRALHLSHSHIILTTSNGSMRWNTRARADAAIHVAPLTHWFFNFNSKLKRLPLLPTLTLYSHSLLTPCTVVCVCVWSASRTLSRSCYNISPRIPCMARSCGQAHDSHSRSCTAYNISHPCTPCTARRYGQRRSSSLRQWTR